MSRRAAAAVARGTMMTMISSDPLMWVGEGWLHPFAPRPEEIRLGHISRGLSRIPRFNGHTVKAYSVAEHSVMCARVAIDYGLPDRQVRTVLMHDAAEAYIGDMVRPIKKQIVEYQEIEAIVFAAIADKFVLDTSPETMGLVTEIDNAVLAAEARQLFPKPAPWAPKEGLALDFDCLPCEDAKRLFEWMCRELKIVG